MIKLTKTKKFFKNNKDIHKHLEKIRQLNKKIDNLIISLEEVEYEHDYLSPGVSHEHHEHEHDHHAIEQILESLPVCSLRNSLDLDYGRTTGNFSLNSMKKISILRRKHDVILDELNKVFSEKQLAEIELAEAKIKGLSEKAW